MLARRWRIAWIVLLIVAAIIVLPAVLVDAPRFPTQPIKIPASKVQPQLQVSYTSAFLLAPDGSLWTWGEGSSLFLQRPTIVPQQVGRETDWKHVTHRFVLAAALKTNGTLWTWPYGKPGASNNPPGGVREPIQLGLDNDWTNVAAGASHALALKRDGTLWAWGQNDRGQVGDGTRVDRKEPVRISDARNWKTISAGHFNSYALKGDGTLWGWGIAIPTSARENDALEARLIDRGTNWMAMSSGDYHLVAIKTDGTLWLLGHNAGAAAPDCGAQNTTNFIQVGADTNWVAVYSGGNNFLARKRDGSWWGCGENSRGELGLRTKFSAGRPTALPISFEPWAIDTSGGRTVVLLGDGTLWLWGDPFGPKEAGLGAKLKKLINTAAQKIGWGTIFLSTPVHRPDPILIWNAD
jgi:alpha-tubulin suppressor-like RCC1 family protein